MRLTARSQGDESAGVWKTLRIVMKAFNMQNDCEWTKRIRDKAAFERNGAVDRD